MKPLYVFILLLLGNKFQCQQFYFEDGICFERPFLFKNDRYKYSEDNISYKLHASYTFDYYYLDEQNKKYKILYRHDYTKEGNSLDLADYEIKSVNVIDKIRIDIDDYREAFYNKANYPQTVISYYYINGLGKTSDTIYSVAKGKDYNLIIADEFTGVVDNKINLWIHPPRNGTFKLLQLSPYPFYILDSKKNNWSWNLETGGFYLDIRWIPQMHENKTIIKFEYKRGVDEIVDSPEGKIKCKVVYGTGNFEVEGKKYYSSLKSYYHPTLGFVRLEYANVNKSKIIFQLINVN